MRLKDVSNGIALLSVHCDLEAEVTHLTIDSRRAQAGTLFCAVYGAESKVHGVRYAAGAVKNGAVCVLTDVPCEASLPYVLVENAEVALAIAAAVRPNACASSASPAPTAKRRRPISCAIFWRITAKNAV